MFTRGSLAAEVKRNIHNLKTEISVSKRLDLFELQQISSLYSKWLIEDPCSHCACFGGVQYAREPLWIKTHAELPGARMVLAKKHDEITGFAQFFVQAEHFPPFAGSIASKFCHLGKLAYIYLILVDPDSFRRGLGKEIYRAVFNECRNSGCDVLIAEIFVCPVPNSSSLRFHEAMGFEYSGESTSHLRQIGDKSVTLSYTQLFKRLT